MILYIYSHLSKWNNSIFYFTESWIISVLRFVLLDP